MPRHADDDLLALAHVAPAWSPTAAVDVALDDPDARWTCCGGTGWSAPASCG